MTSYLCVLLHHRLPTICCALLCSGALFLCIGSATTCQFLKINYNRNPHSPLNNFDSVPILEEQFTPSSSSSTSYTSLSSAAITQQRTYDYSDTHDLGLFCTTSAFIDTAKDDLMWQLARGFEIASLVIVSICTLIAWSSTIFKVTHKTWKVLSILTISAAGVETPVFLFYACTVCQGRASVESSYSENTNYGLESCTAGKGFFMLLWSVISLITVTVVTQCFNYPEYIHVLEEWRVDNIENNRRGRGGGRKHFISMFNHRQDRNYAQNGGDNDVEHGFDVDLSRAYLINGQKNHDDYDPEDEQDYEDGQKRTKTTKKGQGQGQRQHQFQLADNPHGDEEEGEDEERIKKGSPLSLGLRFKSLFFDSNHVARHEVFQEDSEYADHIDHGTNNPHSSNSLEDGGEMESQNHHVAISSPLQTKARGVNGTTEIDMDYLDTKSDSSRLMIRISSDGKVMGDDRNSVHSFEVDLDDYSIDNRMNEMDGPTTGTKDSVSTTCTVSTPNRPCHVSPSINNIDGMIENDDSDTMVYPAQFSPASRAATATESGESWERPTTFPTQQLRGNYKDDMESNHSFRTALQNDTTTSPLTSDNNSVQHQEIVHCEPEPPQKTTDTDKKQTNIQSIKKPPPIETRPEITPITNPTPTSKATTLSREDRDEFILDMSFIQAMVAGTNAAQNSNNVIEDEPEPVYYSSSESETSSISTCSYDTNDSESYISYSDDHDTIDSNLESEPYSDASLPKTTEYLEKKIRRLRRKLEKKKAAKKKAKARKSSRSCRSVCSKVSLMDLTIDEETDMDLELEDKSGDEDDGSNTLSHFNVVSPMHGGSDSVKSSPAGFDSLYQSKHIPAISVDHETNNDDGNGFHILIPHQSNTPHDKKLWKDYRQHALPIVSPTNNGGEDDNDNASFSADDWSCSDSISTKARSARMNRIRIEMMKSENRPERKLSDIVRANDSFDVSYGSDEASC